MTDVKKQKIELLKNLENSYGKLSGKLRICGRIKQEDPEFQICLDLTHQWSKFHTLVDEAYQSTHDESLLALYGEDFIKSETSLLNQYESKVEEILSRNNEKTVPISNLNATIENNYQNV